MKNYENIKKKKKRLNIDSTNRTKENQKGEITKQKCFN